MQHLCCAVCSGDERDMGKDAVWFVYCLGRITADRGAFPRVHRGMQQLPVTVQQGCAGINRQGGAAHLAWAEHAVRWCYRVACVDDLMWLIGLAGKTDAHMLRFRGCGWRCLGCSGGPC